MSGASQFAGGPLAGWASLLADSHDAMAETLDAAREAGVDVDPRIKSVRPDGADQ